MTKLGDGLTKNFRADNEQTFRGRFDQIVGTDNPKTNGRIDRDGLIWERIDQHPC